MRGSAAELPSPAKAGEGWVAEGKDGRLHLLGGEGVEVVKGGELGGRKEARMCLEELSRAAAGLQGATPLVAAEQH
jgi:hypothetical protein